MKDIRKGGHMEEWLEGQRGKRNMKAKTKGKITIITSYNNKQCEEKRKIREKKEEHMEGIIEKHREKRTEGHKERKTDEENQTE